MRELHRAHQEIQITSVDSRKRHKSCFRFNAFTKTRCFKPSELAVPLNWPTSLRTLASDC
jgi:hypothetical protein